MDAQWGSPIRYTYQRHELVIKLKWTWPGEGIPHSAKILYGNQIPGGAVVVWVNGPWRSLDEAMSEVILAAEYWVECQARVAHRV